MNYCCHIVELFYYMMDFLILYGIAVTVDINIWNNFKKEGASNFIWDYLNLNVIMNGKLLKRVM